MLRVMGPRALVSKLPSQALTSKLIEVIQNDPGPEQFAVVISVGMGQFADRRPRELEFKPLDMVVLKSYCGTPVTVNGESLYIVMEEDVLAVVEG